MRTFLKFINILLAALVAGTSFGIWMGFNPFDLSPAAYIEQQRHIVTSLNTLMVSIVFVATLFTLASAVMQINNKPVLIALLSAAAFFLSCTIISRFGNQPIQELMMNWNPASPPSNWEDMRVDWWHFHILRTVADLLALLLVIWAGVQPVSERRQD
jgi:archaellum biogenesis protein FlaJ (TadC family)